MAGPRKTNDAKVPLKGPRLNQSTGQKGRPSRFITRHKRHDLTPRQARAMYRTGRHLSRKRIELEWDKKMRWWTLNYYFCKICREFVLNFHSYCKELKPWCLSCKRSVKRRNEKTWFRKALTVREPCHLCHSEAAYPVRELKPLALCKDCVEEVFGKALRRIRT